MPFQHQVEALLGEIVEKHNWFIDPFSCQRLAVTENSLKVVVTCDGVGRDSTDLQCNSNESVPPVCTVADDNLLPVFHAIASNLLPCNFDFRSNRRVLIFGGPACGKTTLLKHMAVLCALQQSRRPALGRTYVPFVPLLIPLQAMEELIEERELHGQRDDLLSEYFSWRNAHNFKRQCVLSELLRRGRFWLLLDGIDEISSSAMNHVMLFLEQLLERTPELRIVMTGRHGTRLKSQREAARNLEFTCLRMRPLTTLLANELVENRLKVGESSSLFFAKPTLPAWLKSELRRPQFMFFRKSPMTLMLLVNVLQDLDEDEGAERGMEAENSIEYNGSSCSRRKVCNRENSSEVLKKRMRTPDSSMDQKVQDERQLAMLSSPRNSGLGSMALASPRGRFAVPRVPSSGSGGFASRPTYAQLTPEEEERAKKSCQGQDLTPPYMRNELFRRAVKKLLRWRPVASQNKTTCVSPVRSQKQKIHVGKGAFPFEISALDTTKSETNGEGAPVDPGLLQVLQIVSYFAHERKSRHIKLRALTAAVEHADNPVQTEIAVRGLIEKIKADEAPLFTVEDKDDFIEEETLEQQQHQRPRRQAAVDSGSVTTDELKRSGIAMFLHQSLQEHFAAEYIANVFLSVVDEFRGVTLHIDEGEISSADPRKSSSSQDSGKRSSIGGGISSALRNPFSRSRSRSVYGDITPATTAQNLLKPKTPRRASVSGSSMPLGVDYSSQTLRDRLKTLVERFFLGHFDPVAYRVASDWWHPVLLGCLDILYKQAPPPIAVSAPARSTGADSNSNRDGSSSGNSENSAAPVLGPTLFDTVTVIIFEACTRMQSYNNGRAPESLESLWLAAASYGNVQLAKAFMKHMGVRTVLQAVNEDWNNAMHLAAVNNQPEIIKLLMKEDDVDADYLDRNNRHGWDPSNMAMVFNHTHCFRLLCCTDGDRVAAEDDGARRPPLVNAAMVGDLRKVRELIHGVPLESDKGLQGHKRSGSIDSLRSDRSRTSSIDSYCDEDTEEEDEAVSDGATACENRSGAGNEKAESGCGTATGSASERRGRPSHLGLKRRNSYRRCINIGRMCSSAGNERVATRKKGPCCDINAKGSTGMTAAMWAARNGHRDILEELIDTGANVNARASGISTLIFAVESGHVECVELLLAAGADAMDRTPDDDSSLLCACSFGFDDVAKVLIGAGASALEALVVSCVQGKDATVRSLVEGGLVDVNTVWNDLMVTPLAGACVAGHVSTVKLLLALGADPNVGIDVEYGCSPLMLACHMGNPEVVQTMIDAGADVNARTPPSSQCAHANGPNTTAVSVARLNGHDQVERILRAAGAKSYIPVDLTMFEWLGGHVHYPLMSPDFEQRRLAGTEVSTLLDDDEFVDRVDLFAWQFLDGRTAGEAAWDP